MAGKKIQPLVAFVCVNHNSLDKSAKNFLRKYICNHLVLKAKNDITYCRKGGFYISFGCFLLILYTKFICEPIKI